MKRKNGQVLLEYILLSMLVLIATVAILRFMIFDVFHDSLTELKTKTSKCVSSNLATGQCK